MTGVSMASKLKGPPISWLLLVFSLSLLTCIFLFVSFGPSGSIKFDQNFCGFISGGFLGVVALARYEYVDFRRRASRQSYEWSLISGRVLARMVAIAGWLMGVWHAVKWVMELTR